MAVRFRDPFPADPMADGTIHTESLGVDMFWGESMIHRLIAGGVPTKTITWRHGIHVGALLRDLDTGSLWIVRRIQPRNADDWFDGELEAICTQPWNEVKSMMGQRVEWLEDAFLPRLTAIEREGNE
jgi:hypothetical protein